MTGLITFVHVVASILLIVVILAQSGRGGGLTEMFASAENVFGANTSAVLVKGTQLLAVIFIITSLSLAFLSSKRDQSLMSNTSVIRKTNEPGQKAAPVNAAVPVNAVETTAPATAPVTEPAKEEAPVTKPDVSQANQSLKEVLDTPVANEVEQEEPASVK